MSLLPTVTWLNMAMRSSSLFRVRRQPEQRLARLQWMRLLLMAAGKLPQFRARGSDGKVRPDETGRAAANHHDGGITMRAADLRFSSALPIPGDGRRCALRARPAWWSRH